MNSATILEWLLTYAIHSTALLGAAALLTRWLESDVWRETLWRAALAGALLTTTLPIAAGYTPLVGRLMVAGSIVSRQVDISGRSARSSEALATPRADERADARATSGSDAGSAVGRQPASPGETAAATEEDPFPIGGTITIATLLWAITALALLGRLALRHRRLFRLLAGRSVIRDGVLAEMLAALKRNAGVWRPVRLTSSSACATPIAVGRSEICLPKRFLTDLDREQQRTALAHELAHLVRRDPLWELFAGVVQALFFFQPLHRVARLELRSASENLCDDWAVRQTSSPLGLARCLTDVAGWIGAGREPLPAGTIAMAEGGSSLLSRVRRLTADELPEPRGLGLRLAVAALLLGLTAAAAPAISLTIRGAGQEDAGESTAAAPEATPLSRDSVIFHPDPSLPLSERWRWALEQDLPGGFWIAWGIDSLGGDGEVSGVSSNSPGPGGHTPGAPAVTTILADIPGQVPAVAFIFGFDQDGNAARDIDWIRIRSAAEPLDLSDRPLLWLGGAGAGESLAHLETLYAALANPALRKEIAAAFTLHAGPGRVLEATAAALEREADPEVRAEAVQWLPRSQPASEELTALLLEIAFSDPSADVRIEAVDALAALDSPSARRALNRIVDDHPNIDARSEAAQALARRER